MAAARRFQFRTVFDDEPRPAPAAAAEAPPPVVEPEMPEPEPAPTFSEADLVAARQEAFAAGREDGIRQAAEAIEQRIAETMARIVESMDGLFAQQSATADVAARDAAVIAVQIARKVLPALAERCAAEEIGRLVSQAMALARDEPRVVIRVAEALREPLEVHLRALTEGRGFQGQIVLTGDPAMAAGDCAVEWSAGGAERDTAALWRQIDAIVERNLNEAPAPTGDPVSS